MLSLAFSGLLMGYLLARVEWAALRASLQRLSIAPLIMAFLLMLLSDLFLGLKCYFLRPELPFWRMYCMQLNMRFFSLMPGGGISGEAARLLALREMTSLQEAAALVILDKQTHMIPAQTFCLIGLLFASIPVPEVLIWLAGLVLLLPMLVPGTLLFPQGRRYAQRLAKTLGVRPFVRVVQAPLRQLCLACEALARHPGRFVAHLLCGFVGEGCTVALLMLLSSRLALGVPGHNWLWLNSMMLLAMAVPLSTMGMGVREGAMVLLLGLFDVPTHQAVGLPLILSALTLIKGVVGGAVAALDQRGRQIQVRTHPPGS